MKTTIKQWLTDVIRIYNMGTPSGRRRELEETIESHDVNLRLHGLGDEAKTYRDKLIECQREYYKRYGEHYNFGTFEMQRRQKEQGLSMGRKIA